MICNICIYICAFPNVCFINVYTHHIVRFSSFRRKILPLKASAKTSEIKTQAVLSLFATKFRYNFVLGIHGIRCHRHCDIIFHAATYEPETSVNSFHVRAVISYFCFDCSLGSFSHVAYITSRCSLGFSIVELCEKCIDRNTDTNMLH